MNNFAAFILTHGRPDNVLTYKTLRNQGYTGKIFLIVDDEDTQLDKYKKKYKEEVIVFSKSEIAEKFDEFDNNKEKRSIVYARNANFEIAEKLNIKYFIQLDDDYTSFRYRYINEKYTTKGTAKNLDEYFKILLNFYKNTNVSAVAFAQGGDFIGGESSGMISNYHNMSRKCMNSFILSTERKFFFEGRINEDVNTYVNKGSRGYLFLTIPHLGLEQKQTQSNKGGMTDIYQLSGTYIKSFFTLVCNPNSVSISLMGFKKPRLHHSINWNYAVPKILDSKHKK